MAISEQKLKELILKSFSDAIIDIKDLAGDNDHYEIKITSDKFCGKSKIEQHRMVNKALEGYLGVKLHALSIKTNSKM
jgi:phosphoribosylformylglycinamidine synthase